MNKKPAVVSEDGLQNRNFVHVRDVTRANVLAAESGSADGMAVNIGTSQRTPLLQLFGMLQGVFGDRVPPDIVDKFQKRDLRRRFAGIGRFRSTLEFELAIDLEEGVNDLVAWARAAVAVDRPDSVFNELQTRALLRSL